MDEYEITIAETWRYKDHKRGPQLVEAGRYRVPSELKDAVARMAIEAGAAVVISRDGEAVATKPKTQRKKRAPLNKSRGVAPENKTTLV